MLIERAEGPAEQGFALDAPVLLRLTRTGPVASASGNDDSSDPHERSPKAFEKG
jgi:hypothetical protein